MAETGILGVNPKNAYNFVHFLETRGVYDYETLQPYKLADLFLEYQADYVTANFSKVKSSPFVISERDAKEPFTLTAIATMAEYAESEQQVEAMHCISEALRVAVEGGANIYKAISLSIKCKERADMQEELAEDQAIATTVEKVFRCGSTEGRLRQYEEYSPYFSIIEKLSRLSKGREEARLMYAKHGMKASTTNKVNDLEEDLDELQAAIMDEILAIKEQMELKDIIKSKREMLAEEQKYMKEQNLSDQRFEAENTIEAQSTAIGIDMINNPQRYMTAGQEALMEGAHQTDDSLEIGQQLLDDILD